MNKGFFYKFTIVALFLWHPSLSADKSAIKNAQAKREVVRACVPVFDQKLSPIHRAAYADCLGWQDDGRVALCRGRYALLQSEPMDDPQAVRIQADHVSFYSEQRSLLQGQVEVQQENRMVSAETAYIYRDPKSQSIQRIELLNGVRYQEPGRLMLAEKATIQPGNRLGKVENVLYRFDMSRQFSLLPAWGRAEHVERLAADNYLLEKATYSNCSPKDNAWEISADKISIDQQSGTGVAKHAYLKIKDFPVLYSPYLSFPTRRERKSGFLMPFGGYTNVGGYDLALPYYLNLAPNYDATFRPHYYSRRGLMLGGEFRYLDEKTHGMIQADIMPHDSAFATFLNDFASTNIALQGLSTTRWALGVHGDSQINSYLQAHVNFDQVSDDYYLQDFSTNLAVITERQLRRQADLRYASDHWIVSGMVQSYQTLNPINLSTISDVYERLPQIMAKGFYEDLPWHAMFTLLGQYDQFHWPKENTNVAEGPRFYLNPLLKLPQLKPWGFITPAIDLVARYYEVNQTVGYEQQYDLAIPRYSVDSGLFFERGLTIADQPFTQTLEPRLFYLYVPYRDQSQLPVYDSGYMVFNSDQLFRWNRFSGFDRIGDANQLSYALSSRFISDQSGAELASLSVGQIRYFSERQVQLCYASNGLCIDNPDTFGALSPTYDYSPVVARMVYHFNSQWRVSGEYAWDPATRATNNAHLNFHYQPDVNKIVNVGYTFLVNADTTAVSANLPQTNNLHQAVFSYAWPFTDHWSSLGVYSYNISKGYNMLAFLGLQYDSCCWALRLMGGQSYKNLNEFARPVYNNNVYLQILLKGLGSVSSADPYKTISTYVPGYRDYFHKDA